jgi:hypothetical protein
VPDLQTLCHTNDVATNLTRGNAAPQSSYSAAKSLLVFTLQSNELKLFSNNVDKVVKKHQ